MLKCYIITRQIGKQWETLNIWKQLAALINSWRSMKWSTAIGLWPSFIRSQAICLYYEFSAKQFPCNKSFVYESLKIKPSVTWQHVSHPQTSHFKCAGFKFILLNTNERVLYTSFFFKSSAVASSWFSTNNKSKIYALVKLAISKIVLKHYRGSYYLSCKKLCLIYVEPSSVFLCISIFCFITKFATMEYLCDVSEENELLFMSYEFSSWMHLASTTNTSKNNANLNFAFEHYYGLNI